MSFGFLNTNSNISNNPYRQLIDSLIEQESGRKVELQTRIKDEGTFKNAVNTVSSNLSSFNSTLKDLEIGNGSILNSFSATVSDERALTISTSDFFSESGNLEVDIKQLAKADTILSVRSDDDSSQTIASNVTDTETNRRFNVSLPAVLNEAGDPTTFTIEISELAGRTDREILLEVANKLNTEAGAYLNASVISEKDGTSRLRVRAENTGEDARLEFSAENNPGEKSISAYLGLTDNKGKNVTAKTNGTTSGRLYDQSELNAQFTIDGIEFERSGNTVENVLPGLSLELKKESGDEPVLVQISTDLDSVKSTVQSFIDGYNRLTGNIRANSTINAETGQRGILANNRTFSDLSFSLRNRMIQSVDTGTDEIRNILDIGLEFRETGELVIADNEAFEEALFSNLDAVKALFSNSENGIANGLQQEIDIYLKSETGVISSITRASNARVNAYENRLESEELFLRRRENILTQQFLELEQLSLQINNQFSSFSAILGGG